jgi:hypothetical protein
MTRQIFELIPKVMADIGGVAKTRKNEQQKYQFRGIEDMYLAAHPAMVKHGVFCAPEVIERTEYRLEKTNEYGKTTTWIHVMVKVAHRFYAPDGSFITVTTCGEGLDNSDKATNKSMSGAMKYALIELFCVPTEDLDDADRTTPEAGLKRSGPIAEPVTLVPTPPAKVPELSATFDQTELAKAFSPVHSPAPPEYITKTQRQYLAKRFRESMKPEKQAQAEEARHAALAALETSKKSLLIKSRFVDDAGKPTSEFILASEYDAVGKILVKAAKAL